MCGEKNETEYQVCRLIGICGPKNCN